MKEKNVVNYLRKTNLNSDEGVRTDGTGVHLVIDHVAQLDHVDHADSGGLVEPVTGAAVAQAGLAISGHAGLVGVVADILDAGAVEDRSAELESEP